MNCIFLGIAAELSTGISVSKCSDLRPEIYCQRVGLPFGFLLASFWPVSH